MFYTKLAAKTILNNKKQYRSLFAVCLVGLAIMMTVILIADGMITAVNQRARVYYGGDLQLRGGNYLFRKENYPKMIEKMKAVLPSDIEIFSRFETGGHDCMLYYEGQGVIQRIVKGVDFEEEKNLFESMTFIQGSAKKTADGNGIIVSEQVANQLLVHVGDVLTFQVEDDDGFINTVPVLITGIFQDASLLGSYTSYVEKEYLSYAMEDEEGHVDYITFCFKKGIPNNKQIEKVQSALEGLFPMCPLNAKSEWKKVSDEKFVLLTMKERMEDLEKVIEALQVVVLLIVLILMAIIAVGIGSTYKVIVMRRITEIGIYRALGMKSRGVKIVFLQETMLLLFSGFIGGIILSLIGIFIISRFDFSFIPAFDLFLQDGRLLPHFDFVKCFGLLVFISVTTLLSVLFTIRNIVHISPVGALATTA